MAHFDQNLKCSIFFWLNEKEQLDASINVAADLKKITFVPGVYEFDTNLKVGSTFTYNGDVYTINEIRTFLNILPGNIDSPDYGTQSLLDVHYYISKE